MQVIGRIIGFTLLALFWGLAKVLRFAFAPIKRRLKARKAVCKEQRLVNSTAAEAVADYRISDEIRTVQTPQGRISFRVFKAEKEIEVWVSTTDGRKYRHSIEPITRLGESNEIAKAIAVELATPTPVPATATPVAAEALPPASPATGKQEAKAKRPRSTAKSHRAALRPGSLFAGKGYYGAVTTRLVA